MACRGGQRDTGNLPRAERPLHRCPDNHPGGREGLDPRTADALCREGACGALWPGPQATRPASLPHSRRARHGKTRVASGQPDAWLRFGLARLGPQHFASPPSLCTRLGLSPLLS